MNTRPNRDDVQIINVAALNDYAPDANVVIHNHDTQAVATIVDDPNASRSDTVNLPIQHAQVSRLQRFALPLAALAILITFAAGGVVGYGVGKSHAAKGNLSTAGWLLTSASINGTPVATTQTVYLSWDVGQTPHDLGAVWYIVDPSAKHPLLATIPIDAASNGQGGIIITLHAGSGVIIITGTLNGNTLQLIIPPGSHLFPAANTAFVTLTFAPSTIAAFNQLVGGA